MPSPSFTALQADQPSTAAAGLYSEYASWLQHALAGWPDAAVHGLAADASPAHKLCTATPGGVFYLVAWEGEPAAIGGLRALQPDVAEIKRLYVRPRFRGQRLGALLLQRLLADARHGGYQRVYLDSAPFMAAAQRLYAAHGFRACPAYPGTEVPEVWHNNWHFMQRALAGPQADSSPPGPSW